MNNKNTVNNRTMRIGFGGLCLGVALSMSVGFSMQAPAVEWSRTCSGLGAARGYAVQQTTDGGFVAVGWTRAIIDQQPAGEPNSYLVKFDAMGYVDWERTVDGEDSVSEYFSVQQTADGGYVAVGYVNDTLGSPDKLFLVRTDSQGDLEWKRKLRKPYDGDFVGFSVQQSVDGGYIVGGAIPSARDSVGIWVVKTDSLGTPEWDRFFLNDGYGDEWPENIPAKQTSDGGYIVGASEFPHGLRLIRLNNQGTTVWERTYEGAEAGAAYSVQEARDGGYVVTGPGTSPANRDYSDAYLLKTDSLGSLQWKRTFGGSKNDHGNAVLQTEDGGYVVAGQTEASEDGDWDAYIFRTDSLGVLVWTKTLGGTKYDDARSILRAEDGGYVIAGTTWDESTGYFRLLLVKLGTEGKR